MSRVNTKPSEAEMLQNRAILHAQINKYKVDVDFNCFKKSDSDRDDLRKEKKDWNKLRLTNQSKFEHERNEFLRAFIDSPMPNWNISMVVNN